MLIKKTYSIDFGTVYEEKIHRNSKRKYLNFGDKIFKKIEFFPVFFYLTILLKESVNVVHAFACQQVPEW